MELENTRAEFFECMRHSSTKNQKRFGDFWLEIIDAHKQNDFFTLERVEEAIKMVNSDQLFLSDEMIMALILQNYHFNPFNKDHRKDSAAFAKEVLVEKFGWKDYQGAQVENLIMATNRMTPFDSEDRFALRIMYDFKMLRLALPWEQFLSNMEMVRKEYTALTTKEFLAVQLAVFNHFRCLPHIFSLLSIRERFEAVAKENVAKYIVSLEIQKTQLEEAQRVESSSIPY